MPVGDGIPDVVSHLRPLLESAEAQEALELLRQDFLDPDGLGPMRAAEFITGGPDEEIQADIVGFIRQLLQRIDDLAS